MMSVRLRFGLEPRALLALGLFTNHLQAIGPTPGGVLALYRWKECFLHLSVFTLKITLMEPPRPILAGVVQVDPVAQHMHGTGIPHLEVEGIQCSCPICESQRRQKWEGGGAEKQSESKPL